MVSICFLDLWHRVLMEPHAIVFPRHPLCSATKLVAPRAVTVKVDGLHSVDKRDALIKALLGVKGVTSVTIDQRKGHAIM
jgi:hypothetical protein